MNEYKPELFTSPYSTILFLLVLSPYFIEVRAVGHLVNDLDVI